MDEEVGLVTAQAALAPLCTDAMLQKDALHEVIEPCTHSLLLSQTTET